VLEEIRVQRSGELMKPVADTGRRQRPCAQQRLREEPRGQRKNGDRDADEPARVPTIGLKLLRVCAGQLSQALEIELSGAEIRQGLDGHEAIGAWSPQRRQLRPAELLQNTAQPVGGERVQHDEPLAFALVGNCRHREHLFGGIGELVERVLDLDVRNHLAADLAEPAQPVGDADEAVFVHRRDVAGVVPAVDQDLGGLLGAVQVTLHHVRAADQEQARLIERQRFQGLGIHDANADPRQRVPDAAPLGPHLSKGRGAKIGGVDGHGRRALRAAVTFQGSIPKRSSNVCEIRSGSFSAPAITNRKLPKSSGSMRRA
jgi:hypothetical protein